jgi:hypothetical protein
VKRGSKLAYGTLCLAAAAACGAGYAGDAYHYRAYRTPEPIILDGKADEAVWARAPETARLRLATVQGGHAVPTHADSVADIHAKVVWDGTAAYFLFRVEERNVWDRRNGRDTLGFWMENAVEIYLDDTGDDRRFLEINLAPNGSITDIYNENKYSGVGDHTVLGYDVAGIAVGVDVRGSLCATYAAAAPCNADADSGFGLEVKLPFAALKAIGPDRIDVMGPGFHAPARNLDSCRVNLFYTSCAPKATEPDNLDRVNYAWDLEAGNDFHETSKYGTLTFIDSALAPPLRLKTGVGPRAGRGAGFHRRNVAGRRRASGTAAGVSLPY